MKVSIIVPVYNVERHLNKCLDSLVNQTLKNIEIIIVNDGSLDNSQLIINEYSNKYKNIRTFIKKNGGLSDARNYGLKKAKGEYVLFVDSDDYIALDSCERLYNTAKQDDVDVLIGNYIKVDNGVEKIHNINSMNSDVYNGFEFIKRYFTQKTTPIMAWLLFSKRKFLIKNKLFFKKGIYHEDEHLVPTIMLKAHRIKYFDYRFYYYVNNLDSITNQKDKTKNILDIYLICDELSEKYNLIVDKDVKKLLNNRLVHIRLLAFCMELSYDKKFVFERKKIWGKSCKIKTKLKAMLYCISPWFYFKLMCLRKH